MILVAGEAGIGKTRLVTEFLDSSTERVETFWGVCDDLIVPRPLGPIIDIALQAGLQGTGGVDLAPAILARFGVQPGPTAIVVEDAHWADAATLDALMYFGRRVGRLPIVLVITFRADEVPADHRLRQVIGDIPIDVIVRIPLEPLSRPTVDAMASSVGRSGDEIWDLTGGNPFLVGELLGEPEGEIPETVQDAMASRLARLSDEGREVAEVCALVPGTCETSLIEAVLPNSGRGVSNAVEGGVLDYERGHVGYRHELARRAVEDAIPAPERRSLHRRLGAVLEELGADASRIVHHAGIAEDVDRLARVGPIAARRAARVGAHREAASHYRTILPHLDLLDRAEIANILSEFTVQAYITDDQQAALGAAEQALACYRELGDREGEGRMLRRLSRLFWWAGDRRRAEALGHEAIRILEDLEVRSELARAYSNLSLLNMLAHDAQGAVQWGEKAIATARDVGDDSTLAHSLNNLASARLWTGDLEGWDLFRQSLEVAIAAGLDEHEVRAWSNSIWIALDYRDYGTAKAFLERGLALARDRERLGYDHYMTGERARLHFDQGRWTEAERDARWVLSRPITPGITSLPALTTLARTQVRRGDAEASRNLAEAWRAASASGELQRIGHVALGRVEYAWLRDDLAGANEAIAPAYELAHRAGQPWITDEIAFWLWRVGGRPAMSDIAVEPFALRVAGEPRAAAAAWERLGCPYEQADSLCDSDRAEELLEALEIFDRLGAVPAATRCRARLRALGAPHIPRGPRATTLASPAGLTPRQTEVLSLVASGSTNTEIADLLFISPKTVDHHVSDILARLGAADRVEAGEMAAELGLL